METGCECVPLPTTVPGLAPEAISAGDQFSTALLPNGSGQSWGYGYYGELGAGASGKDVRSAAPGPITSLGGASELDANENGAYALIGPKQTLTVAFAGAGAGKVGGESIVCPPSCSAPKPQGQVAALRAERDPGTGFAGFSGPCTGTGACQVKMSGDQTVTATFGAPKGTRINSATIKSRKKKATFSFGAPGAVTGYECKLVRPKPKRKKNKGKGKSRIPLAKKGKKRKPAAFAFCPGPKTYKNLKPGSYKFEVRALNALGVDATPAARTFKIKKAKPKKRHKA